MNGSSGISGGAGGNDQFLSMVKLLADPGALQAEYERLSALRSEAQAVVDLAGPASEIVKLRADVDGMVTAAKESLAEAHLAATAVIDGARQQAAAIKMEADAAAATAKLAADNLTAKALALMADANTRLEQATGVATTNQSNSAELARVSGDLSAREAALNSRESALNARAANIETLLAAMADSLAQLKG